MTPEERIKNLPDWVDKDLIRSGLGCSHSDDLYMNWIERIVAANDDPIQLTIIKGESKS